MVQRAKYLWPYSTDQFLLPGHIFKARAPGSKKKSTLAMSIDLFYVQKRERPWFGDWHVF